MIVYNQLVKSCFFDPKHVGVLDVSKLLCVSHRHGDYKRGDLVDFYLSSDQQGWIEQASFKAYGNPYLIAGAEYICQQLQGTRIADHPHLDYLDLLTLLGIPKTRYSAALFLDDAYRAIVKAMKAKLSEEKSCQT